MAISLNTILQNALLVQDDDQKITKYKWIVSKTDGTVQAVDASTNGSSVEKAYQVMNRQLHSCKELPSISKEQRMQLEALKQRAKTIKDEDRSKHNSYFGKIYLIFRGFFNGGHINRVSRNLDHTIDDLLKKPLTPDIVDIDTFLKTVSPNIVEDLGNSFMPVKRTWVYSPSTGIIEDVEFDPQDELEHDPLEMQTILEVMHEQLSAFDKLEKITKPQQLQLEKLKSLVKTRAPEDFPIKEAIFEKIDNLRDLSLSTVECEDTIQSMLITKEKIYEELVNTERFFLNAVENSVLSLECLKGLKDDIDFSGRYKSFFKGNMVGESNKANLDNCIDEFKILRGHTENMLQSLEELMDIDTFEKRDQKLAELFESDLFKAYAKQVSVCTRYYKVLCDLEIDLNNKNKGNKKIKSYFTEPKGNLDNNPTNYYISCAQRMPRLMLLTYDLTKNTPGHFASFENVHSAYTQALTAVNLVDRRANYPFKV